MSSKREQVAARYASYAIPHPDFDKSMDMENPFAGAEGLSVSAMREIFTQMPMTFPYAEKAAANVRVRHQQITARDGAELELRIYKDAHVAGRAILFFVTHGGGTHLLHQVMHRLILEQAGFSATITLKRQ
jgi:hypothetical protein